MAGHTDVSMAVARLCRIGECPRVLSCTAAAGGRATWCRTGSMPETRGTTPNAPGRAAGQATPATEHPALMAIRENGQGRSPPHWVGS